MAKKDWMIKESELDDDQLHVLMAVNDKSCIVSGCAGSGKSVLALIKAQRIQKEKGNDYQIIVFTKALCGYMNSGRKELGLNNNFTYYWYWKNKLESPKADYIIVDEIQDFTEAEIQGFINAARKNVFFFGDTAQSIYDGLKITVPVDQIDNLFASGNRPKYFSLYRNYRLPVSIAKIAHTVGVDLEPFIESTYKSKINNIPKILKYHDLAAQVDAIDRIIYNNDMDDVAILLPHNEDVEKVSDLLNDIGLDHEAKYYASEDSVDDLDFKTSLPKVMTYHSAKGLQFGTVFLPNIQPLSTDDKKSISERKALYVAMTRTYKDLYVLYSGTLPFPLSEIDRTLYQTSEKETVIDI